MTNSFNFYNILGVLQTKKSITTLRAHPILWFFVTQIVTLVEALLLWTILVTISNSHQSMVTDDLIREWQTPATSWGSPSSPGVEAVEARCRAASWRYSINMKLINVFPQWSLSKAHRRHWKFQFTVPFFSFGWRVGRSCRWPGRPTVGDLQVFCWVFLSY